MNNKKTKVASIATMLSFSAVGVGLGIGLGFVANQYTPLSPHMANSIFISSFIEAINDNTEENFIKKSDFNKSFGLKDGFDQKTATVRQAFEDDKFIFTLPETAKFYGKQYGVKVFTKKYIENDIQNNNEIYPSDYNSSSPEFKVWFSKGDGESYVEDYITIYNSNLYNFQKTQEELDVQAISAIFKTNNNIKLKNEFYKDPSQGIIKLGTYAKQIKDTDIITSVETNDLKNVNWTVTSVYQDNKIPSTLVINIDFSKGSLHDNYFAKTYQRFEITNFPIENGVDDYKSKVKNFIKDSKNTVGLGEAFTYKTEETQETKTVREEYIDGSFTFEIPSAYRNQANNVGVEYKFKEYVDENSDSAFPDEENSTIPKFKIHVVSGIGTPNEYEEFFIVKGTSQVTSVPFQKTDNEKSIDTLESNSTTIKNDKIELINDFVDVDPTKIIAEIIATKEPENVQLTLSATAPINTTPATFKIWNENEKLKVEVPIEIGTQYKDMALFYKTFTIDFMDETTFNNNLIDLYSGSLIPDQLNNKFTIKTKFPISEKDKENLIFSINSGNGGHYFNEEVIVSLSSDTEPGKEYSWSPEPNFKIDFDKTNCIGDNINFWIKGNSGNVVRAIEVTIPIVAFI